MKLSEAIRLGAMLKPQGFAYLHAHGRTCAMGAAYEAVGVDLRSKKARDAQKVAWATNRPTRCPVCHLGFDVMTLAITHVNDSHRWTREQIADWVEGIERAEESRAEVPDVVMSAV
jgi:hypothetical protein